MAPGRFRRPVLAAALAVLVGAAAPARPLPPRGTGAPARIDAELLATRVAPDTWVVTQEPAFGSNVLVARMPDGAALIASSPFDTRATRAMLAWVRRELAPRRMVVVNTHFHPDGTAGNEAYAEAGVETIAADLTQTMLAAQGERIRDLSAAGLADPALAARVRATRIVPAARTFPAAEGLTLAFGGETVRVIFPGPAHAPDNVVVFFPARGVLFGGCMIKTGLAIGNTADADLGRWDLAARSLEPLGARVVVPGHGPVGGPELLQNTIDVVRAARGQTPPLWAGLEPGPHRVGFRTLSAGVAAWYPARDAGAPMTYRGYPGAGAGDLAGFLARQGVPPSAVEGYLGAPVYATKGPEPAPGPFPLVLVAHGNGEDAADQAVLSEYLASGGYVVASAPSPMIARPMTTESEVGEFAERQAASLLEAASIAARALPVRDGALGVVGHSFGARAALLAAMRDPRVRALVSLDGGIGTATGRDALRAAPSFRAEAPLPAVLHLYEELDPFMTPDFTLLRSLRTKELALVRVDGLHHVHFTTWGFAAAALPELAKATGAGPGTRYGVERVARAARALLDRELK